MSKQAEKPESKRKKKISQREQRQQEKQELDKLICYRYSQTRNASFVAREYSVSHMYVTRAWSKLTDDERDALLAVQVQVDEDLNKKIVRAEAIAGDDFVANIVKARDLMGKELVRRCSTSVEFISDRDFTSLIKLAASITMPTEGAETTDAPWSAVLADYAESIENNINSK